MKLTRRDALMLATALVALGAPAVAADGIGALETRVNDVWGTPVGAERVALAQTAAIFRNQRLETGQDSAAGVRFVDASKLTLGANANAVVDDYVFAGDASRSAVTLGEGGVPVHLRPDAGEEHEDPNADGHDRHSRYRTQDRRL